MKTYNPEKPLISIHIPKSAGSSFSNILKKWYGAGYKEHYHDEKKNRPPKRHNLYAGLLGKKLKRNLCIHGHFNNKRGNGVRDYYPEAEQFITIVRDPFELHVSNYFYVKRLGEKTGFRSGQIHPILKNNWTVEEYLAKAPGSYMLNFLPDTLTIENYQSILEDYFIYIGITEHLQDSVDRLANLLGFRSYQVQKVNISERDEALPHAAREIFIESNPLEWAIYQYACKNYGNNFCFL